MGLLPPTIFLKIGLAISPNKGPAKDAISPSGIAPPLLVFLFLFLLPPMYETPFLLLVFLYPFQKRYRKINTREIK